MLVAECDRVDDALFDQIRRNRAVPARLAVVIADGIDGAVAGPRVPVAQPIEERRVIRVLDDRLRAVRAWRHRHLEELEEIAVDEDRHRARLAVQIVQQRDQFGVAEEIFLAGVAADMEVAEGDE